MVSIFIRYIEFQIQSALLFLLTLWRITFCDLMDKRPFPCQLLHMSATCIFLRWVYKEHVLSFDPNHEFLKHLKIVHIA